MLRNSACRMIVFVAVVAALGLSAGSVVSYAQNPPDFVFSLNYFDNANTSGAPDATVRIINTGASIKGNGEIRGDGDLCAMVYVFDAKEEMSECCGCKLTPNALRTISVNNDLTYNPLLGSPLTRGVIKILSTLPNVGSGIFASCDPTGGQFGFGGPLVSAPSLRAWGTHIDATLAITEEEFSGATLSAGEFADLAEDCAEVNELGSGRGVCTCGKN